MSLPAWNSNSLYNKYTDTYIKGAVDVSGGDIICRNGNLNLVTGGITAGSNTISNTVLGYCKGFVSDAQTQITNLATTVGGLVTNSQNISYSGGGTVISNSLSYTGTLNGVLPSTFAYISTLSSSAQSQLNSLFSSLVTTNTNLSTINSNLATTNSNVSALSTVVTGHTTSITSLTSSVATHTSNLTNITYNSTSTYTDTLNVYVGSYLISEGTTLKNTTSITGSLLVNSQTVSNTQLGYLSGLSGDVQTAIDNLNTKTTGISAGGAGYTNIDFLDVTDFFYSATGSQLDGTTLINGPLSISTTGSILANSLSISPIVLSYLANVTSDIQGQFNSTSGVTTGAQTWSGIKTFNSPPVMSGASISNTTIPDTALVSTFVKTSTAQTIAGIKTFSSPPVMSGASISNTTIPDTALVENYVKTSTAQTIAGIKTFSGNCVFSNNPSFSGNPSFTGIPTFVNATFTGTSLNSPTFASLYSNYLQIQSTASGTGLIFNSNGSSTTAGGFIWSRYTTPTNPATQIGDMEFGILQGASTNGLSIGISTATSNGIRLLPNSITFNSPIVITGNITSNSQTITTAQLGYVSGATSNLQTQITSSATTIAGHTTSITALQTATTNIGYSSPNTTIYGTTNIGNTVITGLLTLPTAYGTLPSMLQLGGSTSSSPSASGVITTATNTNVTSITIGNLGVFLLTWNITFKTTSGSVAAYLRGGVSSTSATFQSNNVFYSGAQNIDTTGTSIHGSTVFTNTSASVTYYLVSYQSSITSLNYTTNSYLQVVRIA